MKRLIVAVLLLTAALTCRAAEVGSLRCEYLADPLGIDATRPRLSWVVSSSLRGDARRLTGCWSPRRPSCSPAERATCGTAGKRPRAAAFRSNTAESRSRALPSATGKCGYGMPTIARVAGASRPAGRWPCSTIRTGRPAGSASTARSMRPTVWRATAGWRLAICANLRRRGQGQERTALYFGARSVRVLHQRKAGRRERAGSDGYRL